VARQRLAPVTRPRRKSIAIIARCRKPRKVDGILSRAQSRVRHGGALERGQHPAVHFRAREARVVRADRLRDLSAHAHDGIERGHRFLKNHGDIAPARRHPLAFRKREQIHARSFPPLRPQPRLSVDSCAGGSSPISASASMDFPLPDSPTNPSDSPLRVRTIRRPRDESIPKASEARRETRSSRSADILHHKTNLALQAISGSGFI